METVTLARNAMHTRFECVLHGAHAPALRSAGEAALDEIERLEAQLSLFRSSSLISRVNSRAATEPVRVTPELFALLERARELHFAAAGAFDITVAPLMRCWGFHGGKGHPADPLALAAAREKVGFARVSLLPEICAVRFEVPGMMLDLGAIGKGYAVDAAVAALREAGVESALVHGGTSTVYGLGCPPDQPGWKIALENPREPARPAFATILLRDGALSVSAARGKFFADEQGRICGHVLDPRTGEPARSAELAAMALPSATDTDALSTALLVLGRDGMERMLARDPATRLLVLEGREEGPVALASTPGIELLGSGGVGEICLVRGGQKPG